MNNIEYEVRILDINVEKIREKLKEIGAEFKGKKDFKRWLYVFEDNENKWIRLRTDGNKTTLTIKEITGDGIGDVRELELIMNDFEKSKLFLDELGLKPRRYEENTRESWEYNGIEYEIDTWPLIPTFLEIEGNNKDSVLRGIELLGFREEDTTTLGVAKIFANYQIDLLSIKELKF